MAFGFAVRAPQWAVTPAAGITLLARLNALRQPACYDVDRMVVLAELWAAAADQGDLLMVKDYLEGDFAGPLATPHGVDDRTYDGWTLLLCASGGNGTDSDDTVVTAGHIAVARYLISRGADVNYQCPSGLGLTPLHRAAAASGHAPEMVSLLLAAGATASINVKTHNKHRTPLGVLLQDRWDLASAAIVPILLRAGASLDRVAGDTITFDYGLLHWACRGHANNEHHTAIRSLVDGVRAAGSWKAYMRRQLPHVEILRLRSLVHRGRATPKRVLRSAVRPARALDFLVRQGDNGIVWNILSYWHATDAPTPIERWVALDDNAFFETFDMSRDAFAALPCWRQVALKERAGFYPPGFWHERFY